VGQLATSGVPAAAETRIGGIHIYCLLRGVSPAPFKEFPYSVLFAAWGPDNALNGMGWGAMVEGGDPEQSYVGASVFPCVFAAQGSVAADVIKLKATQIFTGNRNDQGLPWTVEANLVTGAVHAVEVDADMGTEITFKGQGVVVRI
jgi:hypothetical protein